MQHTEKYKLNLIESSDPFLPDALNENTRKLEQAVSQHLDGMDQRIAVFEAKKFVCGTYTGTGATWTMQLGFTPTVAVVCGNGSSSGILMVKGSPIASLTSRITEGGLFLFDRSCNEPNAAYNYIAFA